jgi:hypothetical protein
VWQCFQLIDAPSQDRAQPAVQIDRRASDVLGTRGQQEQTDVRELPWPAHATQRNPGVRDHPLVVFARCDPCLGIAFQLATFDHSDQNAFTRIPSWASSLESAFVSARPAALETEVGVVRAPGALPEVARVLSTAP